MRDLIISQINNKNFIEYKLKNIINLKTSKSYKGIYFIYDNKYLYIGKSLNIINRLKEHIRLIKTKSHYNKNINKFNLNKSNVLFIEYDNIDLYERYYINLFNKHFKLINIIKPTYRYNIKFYDYNLISKLKNLDKITLKSINMYIYKKLIKKTNAKIIFDKLEIRDEKLNILKYLQYISEIDSIIKIEYSKLAKCFYFNLKNLKITIGIPSNKKTLNKISKEWINRCIIDSDFKKLNNVIILKE